jgi:hypothetical protein
MSDYSHADELAALVSPRVAAAFAAAAEAGVAFGGFADVCGTRDAGSAVRAVREGAPS